MKEIKNITKILNGNNIIKLIGITAIITIFCCISIYIQQKETINIKINDKEFKSEYGKIAVYLSGAVNSPGIYNFNKGVRLEEALNIIGGIKQEADLSKLNLSKVLYDCEKIVIPYIQEEKIEIDTKESQSDSEKVNINEATEIELMTLSGIGEITAKKIIEYRKNGNFEIIEDIKKVPGIGDSKFDKIKDKIVVE
ncbi:MAG: helix-hairpin-helix domain-containing protein [Clostridia bacterium]|nr:helix-hairpin-helix domain-containing protein [Clostridia bacterium]MDD4387195.1 helix-hairpin-helix domain-containing protein [Clostridia bacterium]